jgi:hypothetical protein
MASRISRPVRVSELLMTAVPGLGDHLLEEAIRRRWATTVGPDAARRSQPGEIRAGVLHVSVDNSPWLSEMRLRSDELLGAVRKHHGEAVTSLRFALGRVPARPTASPAPAPAPLPAARLSVEEERSVETIAASVADPALAAAVRRLVEKDFIARRRHHAASSARREDT